MHEQSIVESLLAIAIENAEKAKVSRILRIYLVVGDLSGVVDEAVEFYFSFLICSLGCRLRYYQLEYLIQHLIPINTTSQFHLS